MTDATMVCAYHPGRETTLRCNRCGNPICAHCAVHTPVGYRCKECVRGQQRTFETARQTDFPIAVAISVISLGLATALLSYLGFWGFFVAPVVGGGIAEIVRWAVKRRRSRQLPLVAAIGGGVGVIFYLLVAFFPYLRLVFSAAGFDLSILTGIAVNFLWPLVSGVLMISALYYRLRGIRL
jgi:hypothetical protein